MIISKEFRFEAAHQLPNVPKDHPCGRMHGHSWHVTVSVEGQVDMRTGWVMDFADISTAMCPALEQLDHAVLNDIVGLQNPTSENVALWLWDRLRTDIVGLHSVRVAETCTSSVMYQGNG